MTSPRGTAETPRHITTHSVVWRGVTVEAQYEADWLNMSGTHSVSGYGSAHLQLRVLAPEGAAIPVTDTGYRSHFLERGVVEEIGGVETFVQLWLDDAATDPAWFAAEEKRRQLDLFA